MSFAPSIKQVLAGFDIQAPDVGITELVIDSREVGVHTAFVAVKGHSLDGRDFIPQAISLGAKLIIRQADAQALHGNIEMREQSVIVDFYDLAEQLSALAAQFYGTPADKLDVIAVTGTNGKTSTVQLITQLRELCSERAASIGTLGAGMYVSDAAELEQTTNTTPDACQVQRLLASFASQDARQVALEASSHALVQKRIEGLKTDVGVFTNLTRDHLDYHGTMQAYAQAKRRLIQQSGLSNLVLNLDDPETRNWINAALEHQTIVVFSTQLLAAEIPSELRYCVAQDIQYTDDGVRFTLCTSWGDAKVQSHLVGRFNVSNLLAAIATLLSLGKPLDAIIERVPSLKPVAGRMELFSNPNGANIIVDYAHTPDALEQALNAARVHCSGNLVCVFGCGGDRDKGKRPLMGKIAQQNSDLQVITTDNSRSESQHDIANDILQGMQSTQAVELISQRQEAIKRALQISGPDDLILVAGKGHENYQIIGGETLPYDERHYVRTLLQGKTQ